jgi:hypothetical protein
MKADMFFAIDVHIWALKLFRVIGIGGTLPSSFTKPHRRKLRGVIYSDHRGQEVGPLN